MKTNITIAAFIVAMTGCASQEEGARMRAAVTSGIIGCPSSQIHISNSIPYEWGAECNADGKKYVCSTFYGKPVNCTETKAR